MDIYVVQAGDTISSIAEQYKVTVDQLLIDNGLENSDNLVIGQTIVIVYPRQTYTAQEGDSINSIAHYFGITINQLLRNNPALNDREFIYPGDVLVISYNTIRELSTNGFVYPYISMDILKRSLPYLTLFDLLIHF